MANINFDENRMIYDWLNNNGYVFDFSNNTFGEFFIEKIGYNPQEVYGLSKFQSLHKHLADCTEEDFVKTILSLVEYEKRHLKTKEYKKIINDDAFKKRLNIKNRDTNHNYRNHFFISYRKGDVQVESLKYISETFKKIGIRAFIDFEDISINADWQKTIDKDLLNSKYVVFIFSRNFFESENTTRELEMYWKENNSFKDALVFGKQIDFDEFQQIFLTSKWYNGDSREIADEIYEAIYTLQYKEAKRLGDFWNLLLQWLITK